MRSATALATAREIPTTQTQHPVQRFYQAFLTWDVSIIKRYLVQENIYTAAEIDQVEIEYKRWFSLVLAYRGESVPISTAVDPFWHAHLIFSQDYSAMCQKIAGRYVHHRPAILDDEKELKNAFAIKTLILYREHFGTPPMRFWKCVLCKCGPED